jgi:uncharacterized protein (DUF924 family)
VTRFHVRRVHTDIFRDFLHARITLIDLFGSLKPTMSRADEILEFWFGEAEADVDQHQRRWFTPDPEFDRQCRSRFLKDYEGAAAGMLDWWKSEPRNCLALVLLFDQFPRNMFRDTARAFATDTNARDMAKFAITSGFDRAMAPPHRAFFYLPLQHSETLDDQDESVRLMRRLAAEEPSCAGFLPYAEHHRDVIKCFGRFPHRNVILGRVSTPEEIRFLRAQNS